MHAIDAEIGRPDPPHDRVEIGPVAVEEGARRMQRGGDLDDLALKQPAGVRVGQHQRGDVGAEVGFERGAVDASTGACGYLIDGIAAGSRGCRIGAMCRFRD